MANWCYNFLVFEGNSETVITVITLLQKMASQEKDHNTWTTT